MNEPIETSVPDETVTEPAVAAEARPSVDASAGITSLVLGVAVLACAAAVGFSTSQSSDRDDATAARRERAGGGGRPARRHAHAAEQLASEREETKATLADIDTITTSVHELTDLTGQEVDTLASINQLAIASPDAVDEINAQLARARPAARADAHEGARDPGAGRGARAAHRRADRGRRHVRSVTTGEVRSGARA